MRVQDPQVVLQSHLEPSEKLLWSGKPMGRLRLRPQDLYLIPFSLLWGGFAIFWEGAAIFGTHSARHGIGSEAGWMAMVFPLFGLPFVGVGLYLIFGRFFVDRKQRENTIYGITNERVIILSGIFSRTVKSLNLRSLSDITLSERADGSGTITLGPALSFGLNSSGMGAWPGANRATIPSIDLIPDSRQVYGLLRKAYTEAR